MSADRENIMVHYLLCLMRSAETTVLLVQRVFSPSEKFKPTNSIIFRKFLKYLAIIRRTVEVYVNSEQLYVKVTTKDMINTSIKNKTEYYL